MIRRIRRAPALRGRPRSRVVLRLEGLEWRDQPSGGVISPPPAVNGEAAQDKNQRPAIVDFECKEVGNGLYVITGRVVDESPGGLTVTLGGSTSAAGRTIVTQSDGTFRLTIQLKTDGTDAGFITATAVDRAGLVSDPVSRWVDPTP